MNACHPGESEIKEQPADLKEEAVNTLRKVLHEQQEWVKVHAAEFLIWSGHPGGVKEAYLKELERFHEKPQYRIGIWRVLTQLSNGDEAAQYKTKIVNAFLSNVDGVEANDGILIIGTTHRKGNFDPAATRSGR